MIPKAIATRYVAPLREGGSLPGLVEAEDLGTYVMKFRGAGQGLKALVAEVIVGELGRRLGLRVPEMKALFLSAEIGRYEADQEVQDLLTASIGLNLGVDFLPGSFGYDGVSFKPPADEAARILWLDAFTVNIDRSWRNPNLLVWHRKLWCIDHGAALYFHHNWQGASAERFAARPYDYGDHILTEVASDAVRKVFGELPGRVTEGVLREVLDLVPDRWLEPAPGREEPAAVRQLYLEFLLARLASAPVWLPQ
ncbi:MAG TPA: HipA family kinase [Actinomycetota bacterium]|nr:HipA family kinase [Actinomycetota bacterium]